MKHFLPSTALALMIGLGSLTLGGNAAAANKWDSLQPDRDEIVASLNVVELLKRHHYSKPPLDDARSVIIYDSYIKLLDPARSYFTAADIAEFDKWKTQFDDFLKSGNLDPGFTIYKRYLDRVKQRLDFALAELNKGVDKIDFTTKETLLIDRKDAPWMKNQAELDDLWRKRVKDEVLRQKIAGKEPKQIQETLTKRYKNQLARLDQTRAEDIFQAYINTFAQSYDPHTNYLSPDNAENFDINMSLSLEGIGAVLQSDNDQVKIVRLVPAGPAAKTKQVAPADKIIGVAQGNKEMVDVVGWRLDEVVKLIRGPKGSVVRLEVIPASNAPSDQTSKIVSITREAVKLEEQAAKKSVLKLKQDGRDYKLGIIEIPAFYLDFKAYRAGDPEYKSTTRDVKKLLTELQKEKVDGVVIDLRNNGGGSLQEATELTSLFIDKGPTVLVRNSDGRVDVLEDENPGAFYKGPLALLVNRLSASASEIFAGAMQDYHRALIVGGQTFGKGTVQTIQPLNHGELKLTLAKFYRVSGQSTQHQGVLPDIDYPSIIDTKEIGESALPEAMPWDTIRPVVKPAADPFKPYLTQLKAQHEARSAKDAEFTYIRDRLALAQKLMNEKTVSLNEQERRARHDEIEGKQLALENIRRKAKGEEPLKELKKEDEDALPAEDENTKPEDDAYLSETGRILLDYLSASSQVAKH
ncbi:MULTISPECIES: carboxy terminal-processing peptidase [unclassified Pseudomonas]|jgi:carboxyl-terminal processing protease|uniref:carboxy terminal-processing peptidase n=1 Tax=unclassified Pseudomonas TaxID=196821 RepID=UPI00041E3FAE|nr:MULTISPECIES: carboxy terminal-processing peptidase [unclassified Pseudomonas]MDE4536521.1 carboxy terminal-processing peptidase [Pseudomonas sp. ITEM 17296]SMF13203.1 C-terminal processing peptidase-1. Serine peptidase. MEROPS family S41A [Pseudomonas sp. LAIL14HWK12:I11]SMR74942.1 C-terminal processing peptidase-1. Serine peptidase. MEROPS family S41A [Pseudomonas sp. LAIL14HWK12:I10]SOD02356.1 C-terminal processing peptidase-1. Serine peptidase. MEROPS family S41A [Pseudomonas sp. LAIL14H